MDRPMFYKLVGHEVVPLESVECYIAEVLALREGPNVSVDWTRVSGDVMVSTVFLMVDHNHEEFGEPILFETQVFGGVMAGEQRRYTTWDEAMQGHREMCAKVRLFLE